MPYILIAILLLSIDQASKLWARNSLADIGSIPIIKNFLHLTYVENRGAAFVMLHGKIILFLIATIIAILLLIKYAHSQKQNKHSKYLNIIVAFIIAGAMGNLIDRAFLGFVTDMIDFRGIWVFVFNIADCYVVCGTLALMYYMFRFDSQFENKK